MIPSRLARFLPIALLAMLVPLAAQIMPNAPVDHFRFPMFSDDGILLWELRGERGVYLDQSRVDLDGLWLRVYETDGSGRLQADVRSPSAQVLILENRVVSAERIELVTPTYQVSGTGWEWSGDTGRMSIQQSVRVVLPEDFGDILQ